MSIRQQEVEEAKESARAQRHAANDEHRRRIYALLAENNRFKEQQQHRLDQQRSRFLNRFPRTRRTRDNRPVCSNCQVIGHTSATCKFVKQSFRSPKPTMVTSK